MRDNRRDDYRDDRNRDEREPRWLHGHHHGQNSDRGNYVRDSHFNRGYGNNRASQYGDDLSFNSNADHSINYPQGRFQVGGAYYAGEDYSRGRETEDNPYGVTYIPNDGYRSGRHYEARADYSNRDYDDLSKKEEPWGHIGLADERFGHEVRPRDDRDDRFMGRSSRSDYESYRRYEHGNNMYDNDYSTGFSGRNYNQDRSHYGEDSHYSNMERWNGHSDQRHDRYNGRDRESR